VDRWDGELELEMIFSAADIKKEHTAQHQVVWLLVPIMSHQMKLIAEWKFRIHDLGRHIWNLEMALRPSVLTHKSHLRTNKHANDGVIS